MKKVLLSLVMSMTVWAVAQAQTLHTVIVTNYQFVPAVLHAQVGDTVNFSCTLGCHDVNGSQATFPNNPASFGNTTACATWDYTIVITLPGIYQYQSDADLASGMQGTIIATIPVPIGRPFTPGNVVVARVCDGSTIINSSISKVSFLDEYALSPTGLNWVNSVPLPTTANGNNAPFGVGSISATEATLRLSADGTKLVMAGYAVEPGISESQYFIGNRAIALINADATIDTKTGFIAGANYSNIAMRAAATVDGTAFWTAGGTTGNSGVTGTGGGTHYLAAGGIASNPPHLSTTATNAGNIGIFDGQLYATGTIGTVSTVYAIGTGLPTTAGQVATPLRGFPSVGGAANPPIFGSFQFVNMSDTVANSDVLYVVDSQSGSGGVQKWSKVNNFWRKNGRILFTTGAITTKVTNITVRKVCNSVFVFGTTSNSLVYAIDTAGYNKKPSDTLFKKGATAPTNTVFRGVSLTPNTPQPSPPLTLATTTNATCGQADGSATVTVINPTSTYTYAWSNGATGATASNLAPGTYYITISDANGCIQRNTVTLSSLSSINLSLSSSSAAVGASNGSITTTITGGVPPYQFVWTGGATTQNLTNIPAGSYVVSVSDANGCTASAITTVSQINGTSDIANVNSFTAYPNPTNGHYFINLELIAADNVSVSVYDINGRLVAERRSLNAKTVQLDLDLSNEAAGVYSAKIMVGDRLLQVAKIVKMTGE